MRIAVCYEKETGKIFAHFGRTAFFKLYDVQDGKVIRSEIVDSDGQGHGALAGVLLRHHVEVLLCGGIGAGAQAVLSEAGIQLYGGCDGEADAAVAAFIAGKLSYQQDVHCDHHESGCDHEEGTCGHGSHHE